MSTRPYIICHMVASIDGRIDCDMTELIEPGDEYYEALDALNCPSLLMGRNTMEKHYASGHFNDSLSAAPIGREAVNCAKVSPKYTIAVDTMAALTWPESEFDGHLIVITCEDAPESHLQQFTAQGISWIAAGKGAIDLPRAMELLGEHFGVKRLALTGGGNINGAFLDARLIDEISLLLAPGIDGRTGMPTIFERRGAQVDFTPVKLTLNFVERLGKADVWMRYTPIYNI